MKRLLLFFLLSIFITAIPWASTTFKLIESWEHEFEPLGRSVYSEVDKDGHLLVAFQITGSRLIMPTKVVKCLAWGQGPDEVTNVRSIIPYGDDMAILEMPGKIKIFTKKDGTYLWKETWWYKEDKSFHSVTGGVFYNNKWALAGYERYGVEAGRQYQVSYLKVYNEKGQPLKRLLNEYFDKPNQYYLMSRYLLRHKERLLFLVENKLQVRPVMLTNLVETEPIDLEVPGFYKKMPADFFAWKKYSNALSELKKDGALWRTSYSRICKAVIDGRYLVLQVRTCSAKLEKFALLFYRLDNFKLDKVFFTGDLLLGAQNGRFYCFAGGDPGLDEGVEEFKINIYGFDKK